MEVTRMVGFSHLFAKQTNLKTVPRDRHPPLPPMNNYSYYDNHSQNDEDEDDFYDDDDPIGEDGYFDADDLDGSDEEVYDEEDW